MKAYGENRAPRILILGTEWDKWSVVHPVLLISVTPSIGCWVGPIFVLDALKNGGIFRPARNGPRNSRSSSPSPIDYR